MTSICIVDMYFFFRKKSNVSIFIANDGEIATWLHGLTAKNMEVFIVAEVRNSTCAEILTSLLFK